MVPRVLKRNPDCYCILSLQFLILFYAPIPHFIIHTSWILSQLKELKDDQASQETGAGCLGSPEAPPLIPGALPAICLILFLCFACLQMATRKPPGLDLFPAIDQLRQGLALRR